MTPDEELDRQNEIDHLNNTIDDLNTQIEDLTSALGDANDENRELKDKLYDADRELDTVQSCIDELRKTLNR